MWSKVNSLVAFGVALAVTTAASAGADSVEQRDAEAKRWSVALSLTGGFTFQNHLGAVDPTADVIYSVPGTALPAPLRSPTSGVYPAMNPFFGVSGEVMAPALDFLPGDPRFFLNAEILPTFASAGSAVLDGAATGFLPPEKLIDQAALWPATAVAGTGSRLVAEIRSGVYAAGIGVAFPVEIKGRLIRLKPMFGWIRYGVDVQGTVLQAYKDDPDPGTTAQPPYGRNIRYVTLSAEGTQYFNAIGPGLEIEMELPRWWRLRPSLYVEGRAYRVVGKNFIEIEDTTYLSDALGEAVYAASWRLTVADWMGRAGLGFRLRWDGLK